jgi:hypothetical protein
MNLNLTTNTAVVTGASRDIGMTLRFSHAFSCGATAAQQAIPDR